MSHLSKVKINQSDEEVLPEFENVINDYLKKKARPTLEETTTLAVLHNQLKGRSFLLRRSIWQISFLASNNDNLLAIALRTLMDDSDDLAGYAVLYLVKNFPLDLASYVSLQHKRRGFDKIGWANERSVHEMVVQTSLKLLEYGHKKEAVDFCLYMRHRDEYYLLGDHDSADTYINIIFHEGTESQKLESNFMESCDKVLTRLFY